MPKTTDPQKLEKFMRAGVDPRTPGLWKEKSKSGDTIVMEHRVTGEVRPHTYTQEEKQIIKNGDVLQPFQKDEYIKRYGTHPSEDPSDVTRFIMRNAIKNSDIHPEAIKRVQEYKRRFF